MAEQERASHILLLYEGSASSSATRSKEEAATQIAELRTQIENGADFGEIAGTNSDCPSGTQGGDLGMFGRGQMVREFEQTTFAMEVGDLSEVVETSFGYHLITRTE